MKCNELKVYVHPIKKSTMGHTTIGLAYYSKSEVDAAIAELKARIAELEEENKKLTHDEEYFCLNCDVVQDYADDLKMSRPKTKPLRRN